MSAADAARDRARSLPQVSAAPLARDEAERLSRVLKAISDPTRLQLLSMIASSPGGEANVYDLTAPLGFSQPTVSYHLRLLHEAGILNRTKRGTSSWYSIDAERMAAVKELLS